jgi:hypothetical protein
MFFNLSRNIFFSPLIFSSNFYQNFLLKTAGSGHSLATSNATSGYYNITMLMCADKPLLLHRHNIGSLSDNAICQIST